MKFLIICCFCFNTLFSQIPKTIVGKIERIENFTSNYIDPRNVDVWLPDGFSNNKKYAVLYMHDGQMLYDSNLTWNKKAWFVQNKVQQLINENKIKDVIIVGIFNNGKYRHSEYFPQKIATILPKPFKDSLIKNQLQNKPQSDNYLKFIVYELKPFIDKKYPTFTDPNNTFMMGSSMGGLISLYGICEYPNVFGAVACLSLHSPMISVKSTKFEFNDYIPSQLFLKYLENNLPQHPKKNIYMDYGDLTLDALYKPFQLKIDSVFYKLGYNQTNWQTKFFKGTDHSEPAWANRVEVPVMFLLNKK